MGFLLRFAAPVVIVVSIGLTYGLDNPVFLLLCGVALALIGLLTRGQEPSEGGDDWSDGDGNGD